MTNEKIYISVLAHGNVVRARIPLKRIYRFEWDCPVCGGQFEQFTKFVTGATCPTCDHHFERLEYTKNYEKRVYPELADRGWFAGKPLGHLLSITKQ